MTQWRWHIAVWLIGYLLVNFSSWTVGAFTAGSVAYWWVSAYGTIFNVALVYSHIRYLIPLFLNRQYWWRYVIGIVLLVGGISLTETAIDYALIPWFIPSYLSRFSDLFWENVVLHSSLFLLPSLIYQFSADWFRHQQLQRQLREEKLRAELSFLKAQVSPHFLFNTLNNLFASAQHHGDEHTAAGIAQLAQLMRYMLEDSVRDWVPLTKEVAYMEAYIELQQRRLAADDPVSISFVKKGNVEAVQLPPLLLIPFLENAFKHGVRFHRKSFIEIQLEVTANNQLHYTVTNSCHYEPGQKERAFPGLGLQNLQKRLELHYPDGHQLETVHAGSFFKASLKLNNFSTKRL